MRLKNLSDSEVVDQIKAGNQEILIVLFERNLVNALNLGQKNDCPDEDIHLVLSRSMVIVWTFYHSNIWRTSSHKIDFIVDYICRSILIEKGYDKIKKKYSFSEFDELIAQLAASIEKGEKPYLNNFDLLKENPKELLGLTFLEKYSLEELAEQSGKTESELDKKRSKAFFRWLLFLNKNQKANFNDELINLHLNDFINYQDGKSSTDKMLQLEIEFSQKKELFKSYQDFEFLANLIRIHRADCLQAYMLKNASTSLSGNIWGNKISLASAIFIAFVGLLIWYTESIKKTKPTSNEPIIIIDTIKTNDNN